MEWGIFYGVMCLSAYLANAYAVSKEAPRYADAMGVSALLCVSFLVSNSMVAVYGFPAAALAYPILDLAVVILVYRAWLKNPQPWKALMCALLVAQLVMHAAMITVWKQGLLTRQGSYDYVLGVNVIFAMEILTVGVGGWCYALGRIGDWLRHSRWRHSLSDARR